MSIVSFDPKNTIIPIGVYIDAENYKCKLLYPTRNNNNQWVFPDTYLTLKYSKTYYGISPSILPLPPFVKIFYTIISSIVPYHIVAIKELTDPYDFNGILNINKSEHPYKLDIFFGGFTKPFYNTVPLYSYVQNSLDKSLYLSELNKIKGDWISKFHSDEIIISPFFLLKTSKLGFKNMNNICYPDRYNKTSLNSCLTEFNTKKENIHNLYNSSLLSENNSKNNSKNIIKIVIISFIIFELCILLYCFFIACKNT